MCTSDPTDCDMAKRYCKLISAVKIDNLHANTDHIDSPHLMMHPGTLEPRDVLERLIRMNQRYKVKLQHAVNLHRKDFNILSCINTVDYAQPWSFHQSSFDVQTSFTFLDWYIADLIIADKSFNIENIDKEQQVQLMFNILHKGRSIFHMLGAGRPVELIKEVGASQAGD